ncbi:MAG: carboxypeptidase-like regulatory domain-containing protein [Polyangiaceae bacterium]
MTTSGYIGQVEGLMERTGQRFTWITFAVGTLVVLGCSTEERLPNYEPEPAQSGGSGGEVDACATNAAGCPCEHPGDVIDCGEVKSQVDNYVTCMQGTRLCGADGKWGICEGAFSFTKAAASAPTRGETQALGTSRDCSESNPCDPLCREFVDTGAGLTSLPDYMCSTSLGLQVCNRCGYERVTTLQTYGALPADWRILPWSCSPEADNCGMDTHCVEGNCVDWTEPCQTASDSCAIDLTVGRPCVSFDSPATTFHIPICNRGTTRLDQGTLRIGIDGRHESMSDCMPSARGGFPDSGTIEFALSSAPGKFIEPGRCLDINVSNSQIRNLTFTGDRAIVVNVDGSIPECNRCNNSNTVNLPLGPGMGSSCETCSNLSCAQTDPKTTLRGVVYDPAGNTVIPNALVYVPNTELTQLLASTDISCDQCESLISGSPIALTQADATGRFTLPNVPAGKNFPLVIQSGRWRRQVTITGFPAGATRWVGSCSASAENRGYGSANCDVSESEPTSLLPEHRLKFPRTQRRCSSSGCAGEGDIPKMALILSDGDPLQCLLRRIGIAESEMTTSTGPGRIHLYNHNGMRIDGGEPAFGPGGLLESTSRLRGYSTLLAPCDHAHDREFRRTSEDYHSGLLASGPSYNSPPNPTASEQERKNVKDYLDAGGRLFATHWFSTDFVHLNYSPPELPRVDASDPRPFLSPLDPSLDPALAADLSAVAGLGLLWQHVDLSAYNPNAPVVHLFGSNVEWTSNATDPRDSSGSVYPYFDYAFDQSTPAGTAFATWAEFVGASQNGRLRLPNWSSMVRAVRPELGVTPLVRGDGRVSSSYFFDGAVPAGIPRPQQGCFTAGLGQLDSNCSEGERKYWGDEHVSMFQFDTPLGADQSCGRAVVAQTHVSRHACTSPSPESPDCSGAAADSCACVRLPAATEWARGCGDAANALNRLRPEELAFEYLLFSATQCTGPVIAPPVPSALPMRTFSRKFHADCGRTEQVEWKLFSIQATIPEGTGVYVAAKTADTEQELEHASWINPAGFDRTTTTWTSSEHTLDWSFRNQTNPDVSREWLELILTLDPDGSVSPTVSEWRLVYNCVSHE